MPTPFPRTSPRRPVQIVTPRTAGEACRTAVDAEVERWMAANPFMSGPSDAVMAAAFEAGASAAIAFCAAPSAAVETREEAK